MHHCKILFLFLVATATQNLCQVEISIELEKQHKNIFTESELFEFSHELVMEKLDKFSENNEIIFSLPDFEEKSLNVVISNFTSAKEISALVSLPFSKDLEQKVTNQLWLFQFNKNWQPKMLISQKSVLDFSIVDVDKDMIKEIMLTTSSWIEGHTELRHKILLSLKNYRSDTLFYCEDFTTNQSLNYEFFDDKEVEVFNKSIRHTNISFVDYNGDNKKEILKATEKILEKRWYFETEELFAEPLITRKIEKLTEEKYLLSGRKYKLKK